MNADDAGRNSEVTAKRGRRTDFLFVGAGVTPVALMLGDQSGIAILLFIPLLLAACLYGAWEQVGTASDDAAGGVSPAEWLEGKRSAAASVRLRDQLTQKRRI